MPDYRADPAQIYLRGGIRLIDGLLQNTCQYIDAVTLRVIICVYRLRSIRPQGPVHRLIPGGEAIIRTGPGGLHIIFNIKSPFLRGIQDQFVPVLRPDVRMADPHLHLCKLVLRFLFCGLAHPVQSIDAPPEGINHLADDLRHLFCSFLRIIILTVHPPALESQQALYLLHEQFLKRPALLRSGHSHAVIGHRLIRVHIHVGA